MIVIGIDPGTSASSPLGYSRFNSVTKVIYEAQTVSSKRHDAANRIHDISRQLYDLVNCLSYPPADIMCIETTFLRGKGNNSYQQMVGGSMAAAMGVTKIVFVPNTTMKKIVGGHGGADKVDVANGVLDYFGSDRLALEAAFNAEWDITDSLAIGIAGLELNKNE